MWEIWLRRNQFSEKEFQTIKIRDDLRKINDQRLDQYVPRFMLIWRLNSHSENKHFPGNKKMNTGDNCLSIARLYRIFSIVNISLTVNVSFYGIAYKVVFKWKLLLSCIELVEFLFLNANSLY